MNPAHYRKNGFTIVELLIVIVVIGILAAITIVAYSGIQTKAAATALQSDLKSAATQLGLDNINDSKYPATLGDANAGAGLKTSEGTTFQYTYDSVTNTYCLSATSVKAGTSYYNISSATGTVQSGLCTGHSAPGAPSLIALTTVGTLAGSGTVGSADGTGTAATFSNPRDLVTDSAGNIYVADVATSGGNSTLIRKITPAGVVTTLAGSTTGSVDGTGSGAKFLTVSAIDIDASGTLYVLEQHSFAGGGRVRKITSAGVVTTFAGSSTNGYLDATGTAAQFTTGNGLAVAPDGTVYVSESQSHRIRKITPAGVVTTFAGSSTAGYADGTGTAAQFNAQWGIQSDSTGTLYVSDTKNHRIRKITSAGVVTTIAGSGTAGNADGTGTGAQFNFPQALTIDAAGNIYVTDGVDSSTNTKIRKITPAGVVTTLSGSSLGFNDGTLSSALYRNPTGLHITSTGILYVADTLNNRIRRIN